MMVAALEAGGIPADYDNTVEANYELTREQYRAPDFPTQHRGKVIKVVARHITSLAPGNYHIVFMLRDPECIAKSRIEKYHRDVTAELLNNYWKQMERLIGIMEMRTDCQVVSLLYDRVIKNPLAEFERLQRAGWPIDPERAASVVDPSKCHHRSLRHV
jgi:hypothetical protein